MEKEERMRRLLLLALSLGIALAVLPSNRVRGRQRRGAHVG
jgi:hypothetical protein